MLTQQTLDKLYDMKLTAMAEAFTQQLGQPDLGELSFEDRLAMLVDRQWTFKEDRRMTRLLRTAKLRDSACIENIDFRTPRTLDKSLIVRLSGSDWIKKAQNVIILGPTGVGKTYLACAIANSACRNGYPVMYKRAPRLYQEVALSRADGSYPKLMNKLSKIKVLIIDDFCIAPMSDPERRDLWRCWKTASQSLPPSLPPRFLLKPGSSISVIRPWPMPFWTAWFTTPTRSI